MGKNSLGQYSLSMKIEDSCSKVFQSPISTNLSTVPIFEFQTVLNDSIMLFYDKK